MGEYDPGSTRTRREAPSAARSLLLLLHAVHVHRAELALEAALVLVVTGVDPLREHDVDDVLALLVVDALHLQGLEDQGAGLCEDVVALLVRLEVRGGYIYIYIYTLICLYICLFIFEYLCIYIYIYMYIVCSP